MYAYIDTSIPNFNTIIVFTVGIELHTYQCFTTDFYLTCTYTL